MPPQQRDDGFLLDRPGGCGGIALRQNVVRESAELAAAEAVRERQRQQRAARAEASRIAELKSLAQREDETWQDVAALTQQSNAKAYDEAVRLLKKLEALAEHKRRETAFEDRMRLLCDTYRRRSALMRRLREAKLIPPEGD